MSASSAAVPNRFIAWLTLNRGCQLRCNWCYAQESGFKCKMSDEIVDKSLRVFQDLNIRDVCLIGGEPTIDPRFLQIAERLCTLGMHVSVVTNGIKFSDPTFVESVLKASVKSVVLSLKDTDRKSYIESTHKDVFDKVMQAITNLTREEEKGRVKFGLLITLNSSMFSRFDMVTDAIIRSGVKKVTFDTERPVVSNNRIEFDGLTPEEVSSHLVASYPKMETLLRHGVEYCVYITHPLCLFPRWYLDSLESSGRMATGCQIHRGNGIIIDERGEILPCNHFSKNSLGSVDQCVSGSGYTAWRQSEAVLRFYRTMSDYPARRCIHCQDWEKCGAGCRINWLMFGEHEMLPRGR